MVNEILNDVYQQVMRGEKATQSKELISLYVEDVVVVKVFPSIHRSRHPSMDGIIQGRKPGRNK
jgi:hypothetical protein